MEGPRQRAGPVTGRTRTSRPAVSLLRLARRRHPQLPQSWKSTLHTCSIGPRPTVMSKSPSRAAQVGHCALRELLSALAPVSNNPAVKIEIRTVAEAMERPIVLNPVTVQEETANAIAVDDELRAYFEKRAPAGPSDEAIRNYSSRVVKRAYDAMFHAIELKRLVSRFANVDMQTVAPDARAKWLRMLHKHPAAFERDTAGLQLDLQLVFFPNAAVPSAESDSLTVML